MSDELKLKLMQELLKRNVKIDQLIMNVEGDNHYHHDSSEQTARGKSQKNSDAQGKEAIMEYVGRLKPVVKEEYLDQYDRIWEGILELNLVKGAVYNRGKQQGTTFNRNLVANIIHQISSIVYLPTANNVQMAECLEPEKGAQHPVRQKLGESPERPIKRSIEEFMQEIF